MTPAETNRDKKLRELEEEQDRQRERLAEHALSLSAQASQLGSLRDELRDARKSLTEMIQPIAEAIVGDKTEEGIRNRVRNLEKAHLKYETNLKWIITLFATTILGVVTTGVYEWLKSVEETRQAVQHQSPAVHTTEPIK